MTFDIICWHFLCLLEVSYFLLYADKMTQQTSCQQYRCSLIFTSCGYSLFFFIFQHDLYGKIFITWNGNYFNFLGGSLRSHFYNPQMSLTPSLTHTLTHWGRNLLTDWRNRDNLLMSRCTNKSHKTGSISNFKVTLFPNIFT